MQKVHSKKFQNGLLGRQGTEIEIAQHLGPVELGSGSDKKKKKSHLLSTSQVFTTTHFPFISSLNNLGGESCYYPNSYQAL